MPEQTISTTQNQSVDPVPIVAIGASAGGPEACSALLKVMPDDMRAAFVLILHLDPTHDSMMVDLLAHDTALTVGPAEDGMALQVAVRNCKSPPEIVDQDELKTGKVGVHFAGFRVYRGGLGNLNSRDRWIFGATAA